MVSRKIILSLTTIPVRKTRLMENLPSLLGQSYYFDKLVINVDDNLSEDDYKFYHTLTEIDSRIEINKSESRWRSCNKLLPTIKMYPEDIIITVDDDIYYPVHCVKYLVEQYMITPDCVIAHEVNPIEIDENGFITFKNKVDIKLKQVQCGKYLSNCCLFPPHIFDESDVFDYDKMMACTHGTHDELWFWVNSLSNGVQTVGLNYVLSFEAENIRPWGKDEYKLTDFNNTDEKILGYMKTINEMYGEKMLETLKSKPVVFFLDKDNVQTFIYLQNYLRRIYPYGFLIDFGDLTKNWIKEVKRLCSI